MTHKQGSVTDRETSTWFCLHLNHLHQKLHLQRLWSWRSLAKGSKAQLLLHSGVGCFNTELLSKSWRCLRVDTNIQTRMEPTPWKQKLGRFRQQHNFSIWQIHYCGLHFLVIWRSSPRIIYLTFKKEGSVLRSHSVFPCREKQTSLLWSFILNLETYWATFNIKILIFLSPLEL